MLQVLEQFRDRLNSHPDRGRLLKKWNPDIEIRARDRLGSYVLAFAGDRLSSIRDGISDKPHVVRIEADELTLKAVFSGALSPTQAYFDGTLSVLADDSDQVRLDALAYALWEAA